MRVSVIIPNFNGRDLLKKNLPLVLAAKNSSKNQIVEVIVVDDGSNDDSAIMLKAEFPEVKLIKHTINRGFSAAVNTGVRGSRGELVCLINTDVLPENNFLESVFKHFRDPGVFAVSLHEKGYGWAKGFFKDGFIGHQPGEEDEEPHISFWASGGSAVFRKKTWTSLGGFDERLLPFYWEDLDLSYRAQKRGYKVLWDPDAMVFHKHETTYSKLNKGYVSRMRERNQLIFIWKNITSPTLTRRHIIALFRKIIKHPGYFVIFIFALFKIHKIRKARIKEKKESKVSDEAILAGF